MLSVDAKQYVNAYRFANGMLNVAWIAGHVMHPKDESMAGKMIYVVQSNNLNHALPVYIRSGDRLPTRFKNNMEIKVICRVGGKLQADGSRVAVMEALDFDTPTVLDMPPEENWTFKVPTGAPEADFKPSKTGLALSRRSNVVQLAGYVSGLHVVPPGTVLPGGGGSHNGRLDLLISQKENLEMAVPVRIPWIFAEAVAKSVKIGMPLLFNDAQFKVNVDKTGEPAGEDGIVPVRLIPHIEAKIPKIASADDIIGGHPPWAVQLATTAIARRQKEKAAQQAAQPQNPAQAASQSSGQTKPAVSLDDAIASLRAN